MQSAKRPICRYLVSTRLESNGTFLRLRMFDEKGGLTAFKSSFLSRTWGSCRTAFSAAATNAHTVRQKENQSVPDLVLQARDAGRRNL